LVFGVLELEIMDMLHIFWDLSSRRVEDIYWFRGTYWLCVCGRRLSYNGKMYQYVGQEAREPESEFGNNEQGNDGCWQSSVGCDVRPRLWTRNSRCDVEIWGR
jgi:hypothetical protein